MVNEMIDERVTFQTAKLLKEKKFDIGVDGSYTEYLRNRKDPEYPEGGGPFSMTKGEIEYDSDYFRNGNPDQDFSGKYYVIYAAPSQSIVAKWLREVWNIQVYCCSHTKNGKGIYIDYVVRVNETPINDARDGEYQTYEEAMEVGLQRALTMI
jgi:hypothetical protein